MIKETKNQTFDLDLLKNLLQENHIPYHDWGKNDTKTIDHLLKEIQEGSCQIIVGNEGISRVVRSANVRVFYHEDGRTYYLHEDRQVFRDGRARQRNFASSVSEKLEINENPLSAAIRGMQEELGIVIKEGCLETCEVVHLSTESPSYPGLISKYENNFFNILLTAEQFNPQGYQEIQPDKTTYWVWQ